MFQDAKRVLQEIEEERLRQIMREGFGVLGDDKWTDEELAAAGASYAMPPRRRELVSRGGIAVPQSWPWAAGWWKPRSRRRDLIRAAALIVAEIERLDRIKAKAETEERGLLSSLRPAGHGSVIVWVGDGEGKKVSFENWKRILDAAEKSIEERNR